MFSGYIFAEGAPHAQYFHFWEEQDTKLIADKYVLSTNAIYYNIRNNT